MQDLRFAVRLLIKDRWFTAAAVLALALGTSHTRSDELESRVEDLKKASVRFRGGIVGGPGGSKALAEDPDGNLIELFEPAPR